MKEKRRNWLLYCLCPLLYLGLAIAVVAVVSRNGTYPSGSDTMYHIYRGQWLYDSIGRGDLWPLVNPMWYNGVELLRYWPPLPAYFMALCQGAAGGDPMNGYLLFVGALCFFGALPWLWMGDRVERPLLGGFLGGLWFFMPNNLYVLFSEGNLARSLSMVFLPVFVFLIYSYLQEPRWTKLAGITVSFALILLCHIGFGGMVALAALLFLLMYKLSSGGKKGSLNVFLSMGLSFLLLGILVIPSLVSGITSIDTSEALQNYFQSLLSFTLNPFLRFSNVWVNYFGVAAFLLAVLGILCAGEIERSGFWAAILILFSSSTAAYSILKLLPGGNFLWMLRFLSIALAFVLMSYLFWKDLRRWLCLFVAVLLVLDAVPSFTLMRGDQNGIPVEERLNESHEGSLIQKAQEITEQRLALIDFGGISNSAWHTVGWGDPVPCDSGAGWEAANTGPNVSQLERGALEGNYLFVFDRCKELGNDSVLLLNRKIEESGLTFEEVDAQAAAVGYSLVETQNGSRLYHLDQSGSWGVISKYKGIAIGDTSVNGICRQFPAMKTGESSNLDDYTFEELAQYEIVYLLDFTYEDRERAESLITRLGESGVRVIITADGIPEKRGDTEKSFLGVRCNPISFSNGFPEMETVDGLLNTDLFPADHSRWETFFVTGLDQVWGTVREADDVHLDFYGTVKNDNIVVIGLNLTFFLSLTGDPSVEQLLSRAMSLSPTELPERRIVPITVTYGINQIVVESPEDEVNTTLAYHADMFDSDRELTRENNLTVVQQGRTVINLRYPFFWVGLAVSLVGIWLMVRFLMWVCRSEKRAEVPLETNGEKTAAETGEPDSHG